MLTDTQTNAWPPGDSEMARRVRQHDWSATPLGPTANWPDRFKAIVELVLGSPIVASVACGDERILIYNDAAARLYGDRHPAALGQPLAETFPDSYPAVAAVYERVFGGETIHLPAQPLSPKGGGGEVFEAYLSPIRDAGGRVMWAHMIGFEISKRLAAEKALRESQERQVFLLRLSDALRPLSSPAEIVGEACQLLARQLDVDRAYYAEIDEATGIAHVQRDCVRGGVPSLAGEHRLTDFGWAIAVLRRGECYDVTDTRTSELVQEAERAASAALHIIASTGAPLIKNGALVGALCVTASQPRTWSREEVALLRDVGERIWGAIERAHAEARGRESDQRFRQFAASSLAAIWIRDAKTFVYEYVSPAILPVYGVTPDAVLRDDKLINSLILPEERNAVTARIERIGRGETLIHEYRIQRASDRTFRWIRSVGFPLRDGEGKIRWIAAIAEDVTDLKLSMEHQGILLAELQHRVRNIMAVIRAITTRTSATATTVADYASLMGGRLLTLSRVQALLTRSATARVSVAQIIRDEMTASTNHRDQYRIAGPDIVLSAKIAEVFTLAVHELATNAVKYGALSVHTGVVCVTWERVEERGEPWLRFSWIEAGAPHAAHAGRPRRGFGTELIEDRIPYELGGRGRLLIGTEGANARLEFPLAEGASILETDAPAATTVFGGTLDMRDEADLSGYSVLVVEDDYYLASDTARALRGAGAEPIGPFPNENAALDAIERTPPSAAVVDINLGDGPSFRVACILQERKIPFVFMTGYDRSVIPPEFGHVTTLQKPVELRHIVASIAEVLGI